MKRKVGQQGGANWAALKRSSKGTDDPGALKSTSTASSTTTTPHAEGSGAPDDSAAKRALKALALDQKREASTNPNVGAEATTIGAKMMGWLRTEKGKKAAAIAGLSMSFLGMAQPASADVVFVEQGAPNRDMQATARQLAGETGEGYVHVKAEPQALRAMLQRANNGQGDLDHLILEAGPGGVDVEQLKELKAEFPDAFDGVTYVHVIGENVAADPFAGEGAVLFPNAAAVVGFSVDANQAGSGPASAWLVQESGRSLYEMPSDGLSPQAALIKARTIANQANTVGVDASVSIGAQSADGVSVVQQSETDKPAMVLTYAQAERLNSAEVMFKVPSAMRNVEDGQSVLLPLEGGSKMHMIELRYQDTRQLQDLEFNMRAPGASQWTTFRGDQFKHMQAQEKAGEIEIKREPDHNSPWVNNPIRVKVEVVDSEGNVLKNVGKKMVDFHVHDAHSATGSGSGETDNIYSGLPSGPLPEGAMLKLTAVHTNRMAWEGEREVAMDLQWVKPIYMPSHTERATVRTGGYEKPAQEGYDVDADRPIAGVFVKWTDNGHWTKGSVRIETPDGVVRSKPSNVGSGETELIPLDGVIAKDGKIYFEATGPLEVGKIEVLYQ